MVKTVLKASTHIFTVSGVVVAAIPLSRGLGTVAKGELSNGASQLAYDTIGYAAGTTPQVTPTVKAAIVNVGIPIALGIGLVWGGAQLRKRIGN